MKKHEEEKKMFEERKKDGQEDESCNNNAFYKVRRKYAAFIRYDRSRHGFHLQLHILEPAAELIGTNQEVGATTTTRENLTRGGPNLVTRGAWPCATDCHATAKWLPVAHGFGAPRLYT